MREHLRWVGEGAHEGSYVPSSGLLLLWRNVCDIQGCEMKFSKKCCFN